MIDRHDESSDTRPENHKGDHDGIDDGNDEPTSVGSASQTSLLSRPVTIDLGVVRWPARVLTVLLPLAMIGIGLPVSLLSALLAERSSTEAIGTLGVELGAALAITGAVVLGANGRPTVLRVIVWILLGVAGAGLIVAALTVPWHGVGLGLAMEFGVGLLVVPVIDVILIGGVYERLRDLARGNTPVIAINRTDDTAS